MVAVIAPEMVIGVCRSQRTVLTVTVFPPPDFDTYTWVHPSTYPATCCIAVDVTSAEGDCGICDVDSSNVVGPDIGAA